MHDNYYESKKENLNFIESINVDRKLNSTKSFLILVLYRTQHFAYVRHYRVLRMLLGGGEIFNIFPVWFRLTDIIQVPNRQLYSPTTLCNGSRYIFKS